MDLASIGSTVSAASAAASAPTVAILAAGADEVSIAVAALFGMHGQAYQALSVQASAFHQQFVQALTAGAYSYASAEAAAVTPLQQLVDVINAPFRSALGRPLIGNGANGKPGTGQDGGAGGLLYGSGGNGDQGWPAPARRAVTEELPDCLATAGPAVPARPTKPATAAPAETAAPVG
ncbi:PE-PGRS family protein PE_PGRS47 [Mycobacterium tuberculosis variant microti]|nr:PE-PGRS family protein PE_PGRS47 [Mycobacterium tuberculosis variant microti]